MSQGSANPPRLAAALLAAFVGCSGPQPVLPPLVLPPAPPPRERVVPSPLMPTIGFGDPTHTPRKIDPPPPALVAGSPATVARFAGAIELQAKFGAFAPGDARTVPVGFAVRGPNRVPAGIRAIRVAGFKGVAVGLRPEFATFSGTWQLEATASFVFGVVQVAWWLLNGAPSRPAPDKGPLSLDVPRDHTGVAQLRVAVPEDTPPGRYAGRVELEGNFEARSFPLEIEVARFDDRVARLLAGIDAPERELPVAALLAKAPLEHGKKGPKRVSVEIDASADGEPLAHTAWKRWIVAGSGVWDLGAVEWLGPITDGVNNDFGHDRAIAGPLEAPLLFVLNGRSVDAISIRERRTIARIATWDRAELNGPLHVSPDGDRVLAPCGPHEYCFFFRRGEGWASRTLDDACVFPLQCSWFETDPDVRALVVGVTGNGAGLDRWEKLVRYDLTAGKRSEVALDDACSGFQAHQYDANHGLVAGVVEHVEQEPGKLQKAHAVGVRIVRTGDLSVARVDVPPTHARRLTIDEPSGDVFLESAIDLFDSKPDDCLQITPADPPRSRPCEGAAPRAQRFVEGTAVRYGAHFSTVVYVR